MEFYLCSQENFVATNVINKNKYADWERLEVFVLCVHASDLVFFLFLSAN